jgi:hypothetical protein
MENKTINDAYQEIISKCKFISKSDQWFVENTEVNCRDKCNYIEYNDGDKFNNGFGLFEGLTNETYIGYSGELPRADGETCPFEEFLIYDEFGHEISELTLEEYKSFITKEVNDEQ